MKPRSKGERHRQDGRERLRHIRGLVWIAVVALVFAIARAGVHRVFPTQWWRIW